MSLIQSDFEKELKNSIENNKPINIRWTLEVIDNGTYKNPLGNTLIDYLVDDKVIYYPNGPYDTNKRVEIRFKEQFLKEISTRITNAWATQTDMYGGSDKIEFKAQKGTFSHPIINAYAGEFVARAISEKYPHKSFKLHASFYPNGKSKEELTEDIILINGQRNGLDFTWDKDTKVLEIAFECGLWVKFDNIPSKEEAFIRFKTENTPEKIQEYIDNLKPDSEEMEIQYECIKGVCI